MKKKLLKLLPSLLVLILGLAFFSQLRDVFILAGFAAFTYVSIIVSVRVEHITFDSYFPTACFVGFFYGPLIGVLYAAIVGISAYVMSRINIYTLLNVGLAMLCAFIMQFFTGLGFSYAFIITFIIKSFIQFPAFLFVGANVAEDLTQLISQFITGVLIYLPILNLIVWLF